MKPWIGKSLLAIGAIHTVAGLFMFGDLLWPVVREGFFNTITMSAPEGRRAAFWYLQLGFITLVVGGLVDWAERKGLGLPAFLPWAFLALAVIGALMMPAAGFWLLFVPTVGLFVERGRRRAASVQDAATEARGLEV